VLLGDLDPHEPELEAARRDLRVQATGLVHRLGARPDDILRELPDRGREQRLFVAQATQ
jgi:hypothetical protein